MYERSVKEGAKQLSEYIARCQLLGIEPILDNTWGIREENGEICLDYITIGVRGEDGVHRLRDDLCVWNVLKVPNGITRVSKGCFPFNLWATGIKLNLNHIKSLGFQCFAERKQIEYIEAPYVTQIDMTSFSHMQNLRFLALPSVITSEMTAYHFSSLPRNCKLVLPGYTGTVQGFINIKAWKTLDCRGIKLG